MAFSFLQTDTIAQAVNEVVTTDPALTNEISTLSFIFKGGVFLIPIAILLFYTIYVIIERFLFIQKNSKRSKACKRIVNFARKVCLSIKLWLKNQKRKALNW